MTVSPTPTLSELKTVPLLQDLTPAQLKALQPHCQFREFKKGEVVFLEGDTCRNIVIVKEGRLKLSRTSSASGREQILEVLETGHTCACHNSNQAWNCSATALAATDVGLWHLPFQVYRDLVNANGRVANRLNALLSKRLRSFCDLIEEISLDAPDRRLAKFILQAAVEGGGDGGDKDHPVILATHEEIAQHLGLVRETVTRHLQKMKRLELVDIEAQRITIRNRSALERIAQ